MRRRLLLSVSAKNIEPIDINNYLTIEALSDGLTAKLAVSDVEYCVDGDGNWKVLPAGTATEAINNGQTLSFRANFTTYNTSRRFTINKSCNVLGDPMSIYVGDNASSTTSYKYNYTFAYLFYNCTTIVDASRLNLSRTPRTYSCYYMFYGCKGLTAPPELPAKTVVSSCYRRMFQGCTAMTKSPDLPALTLQSNCYEYMFVSCSKLASIKMLATNISASNCLLGWVNAIKSSGTFYKNKDATWTTTGISGVPSGWTIVYVDEEGNEVVPDAGFTINLQIDTQNQDNIEAYNHIYNNAILSPIGIFEWIANEDDNIYISGTIGSTTYNNARVTYAYAEQDGGDFMIEFSGKNEWHNVYICSNGLIYGYDSMD